jgi:hypothetical protein
MAQINRVHGQINSGSTYNEDPVNVTGSEAAFFSGYQPLVLKFTGSNLFNSDSVNGTTGAITDGPRTKAIRAIATFGSILMVDRNNNNDALTVIVDGASFNRGDVGSNTGDSVGLVRLAVEYAVGDNVNFTYADSLNTDGTWQFD